MERCEQEGANNKHSRIIVDIYKTTLRVPTIVVQNGIVCTSKLLYKILLFTERSA